MANYKTQFTDINTQIGNVDNRLTPYYSHPTYGSSIQNNVQRMMNCSNTTEQGIDSAMTDKFGTGSNHHSQKNGINCGSMQILDGIKIAGIDSAIMSSLSGLFDSSMFDGLLDGIGDIFSNIDLNLPDIDISAPDFDFDGIGVDIGEFSNWFDTSTNAMCDAMNIIDGQTLDTRNAMAALSSLASKAVSALGLIGQAMGCGEELWTSVAGPNGENIEMIKMVNPELGGTMESIQCAFDIADSAPVPMNTSEVMDLAKQKTVEEHSMDDELDAIEANTQDLEVDPPQPTIPEPQWV